MDLYERITEAAGFIKSRDPRIPQVGVVLGSGLGIFVESVAEPVILPYVDIPHFKKAGVAGHAGRLVLGRVGPASVAVLQGRIHYYEGHEIGEVVFPLRVLAGLGIRSLLLTNAAGGINREFKSGDLMIIRDHLNLTGLNPLRGVNDDPRIIEQLCRKLVRMRVRPYYLYQCDLVRGVEHFRTPLSRGIEVMEYLRGRLSGLAIPQFVVDAPHGGGKIPLLPNYIVSMSPTHTVLRNF